MLILGIESSCDDTGAAVVEDGSIVLSSVVSSQDFIHAKYGGVVPELASRRHIDSIIPVVEEALSSAGVALNDIGGIAVTQGPGLVGSLLIGLTFAKAVSYAARIPFTGVNHIEAHPFAAFLKGRNEDKDVPGFPAIAMIVSGGHTTLLLLKAHTEYEIIGTTLDDAAGEAFDKVAKLIGLGYPGGAAIDRVARDGNADSHRFTRPLISKGSLDFSFSGLKTAVLNFVRSKGSLSPEGIPDLAASFQEAAIDTLVTKALWALEKTGSNDLIISGGVACNSRLRTKAAVMAASVGARLFIPPPKYCSDNGAVAAALGYHQLKKGIIGSIDMNALPTWEGF
ncbi:MAG: tRNA (adenosine(37)-N6)-threonylcarbamoyltransferase complex transferase subunit TsaD [Deltaproteobacteria bacterium GWB2_55_19]|nr:MAG: tRNA (adenosine(37)-N6)-threonylcarbamoyltransferase complex transferase subunit TsaD [Deltaproteobacteria bacterium GWB2_55_19]HAO93941.1 tRNA (adenosine(37)-N6)-threonylcarbamoyltransferase complex transferase subunit TsaD [Deltaproteobacteria bacterium]